MSVMELLIRMTLEGKSFIEMFYVVEEFLKKFPRECADCGKTLTAEDVFASQGFQCTKCWDKATEELHKENQEKRKNL